MLRRLGVEKSLGKIGRERGSRSEQRTKGGTLIRDWWRVLRRSSLYFKVSGKKCAVVRNFC